MSYDYNSYWSYKKFKSLHPTPIATPLTNEEYEALTYDEKKCFKKCDYPEE